MTKTTETKTTPIASLTPEQFNARFPVGTRVSVLERGEMHEAIMSRPAKPGHGCTVVSIKGSAYTWALSFVHPIVTLGSLNVGDEFRWHAETPSAAVYRVTRKSESGNVYARSAASGVQDTLCHPDTLVQVVALNLGAAQDDRPEVFPGSMLRDGDVVEFHSDSLGACTVWNQGSGPFTFRDGRIFTVRGEDFGDHTRYQFRLASATIPAPAPTEPCPAPVEEEPEHTDEHMAAVAAVRERDKPRKCSQCKAPENKYRHLMPNFKNVLFCSECAWLGDANGTFLPPKPPRKLPPSVAYHLSDDADEAGGSKSLPRWN